MLLTTRLAKALQLTLAVIKPDGVAHPLMLEGDFDQSQGSVSVVAPHIPTCIRYAKALHQKILDNSFAIVRCKDLVWRRQDSEEFYIEHAGRFFYQRLVEFMSSGPMRAYVLAREDAVSHWRELMGPTKVFQARHTSPATIRAQYGLTDTRNTTHGSDSSESARREILYFFPEFGMEEWMEKEEPAFRAGRIEYDARRQIHALPTQS